ncbi:MAG: hypothetical protein OXI54_09340 [Chloroflexota bacterium]|nr:hypothetical protein [Chloroflexota bacterium]MDE2684340.1 hypothetical protein [Chloroflexota bacterium]
MDTENIDGRKDTTTAASEPDDLDRRIAELHAQGVLIGGEGPRESLRPIAYIPGALKRLLERRDRS